MKKNNEIKEVYGISRKEMAPVLLHAEAFDQDIQSLEFIEPYCSYQSIATNRYYSPKFVNSIVPGALKEYDLPDLAATLAPRKLLMANIKDGNGRNADIESFNKEPDLIRTAYSSKNADRQLNIVSGKSTEKIFDLYLDGLNKSFDNYLLGLSPYNLIINFAFLLINLNP